MYEFEIYKTTPTKMFLLSRQKKMKKCLYNKHSIMSAYVLTNM